MHSQLVVHCDLKPSNILWIVEDLGCIRAMISEFGFARAVLGRAAVEVAMAALVQTPGYRAPEVMDQVSQITRIIYFRWTCARLVALSSGCLRAGH